jgi:hypothetical protein
MLTRFDAYERAFLGQYTVILHDQFDFTAQNEKPLQNDRQCIVNKEITTVPFSLLTVSQFRSLDLDFCACGRNRR